MFTVWKYRTRFLLFVDFYLFLWQIFVKILLFVENLFIFILMDNVKVEKRVDIKGFIKRVGIKDHEELAARLGTTKKAVDTWSCGSRKPTFEMVYLLKKMGMTDMELFGEEFKDQKKKGEMDELVADALKRIVNNIGKI